MWSRMQKWDVLIVFQIWKIFFVFFLLLTYLSKSILIYVLSIALLLEASAEQNELLSLHRIFFRFVLPDLSTLSSTLRISLWCFQTGQFCVLMNRDRGLTVIAFFFVVGGFGVVTPRKQARCRRNIFEVFLIYWFLLRVTWGDPPHENALPHAPWHKKNL